MFRLYMKYLKKYKVKVILGPMFKFVEVIFELLVPLIIGNMIDKGINGSFNNQDEQVKFVLSRGGLLLLFAIIGLLSTLVCQFMASRVSQGVGTDIRNDLFKHINELSFKELDDFSTSSLLTRLNGDINNVQSSVAMLIRLVIRAPFLIIGATVLSFIKNTTAGFIFMCSGILLFFIIILLMRIQVKKNKIAQAKLDNLTNITKENISGNRVVRAFNREKEEFVRYCDEGVSLRNIQINIGKINALLNPMVFMITNIAIILVLYVSGLNFKSSNLLQGDIQSLYNYLIQIQLAVMVVANLVVVFTKARASSQRINQVFDKSSSIKDGHLDSFKNDTPFVLEDVSFKYNTESLNALSNINLTIKKGMILGVIGGTGSGKTSLANILNRFYDVTSGRILFYGNDIKDYKLDFVRKNISQVFQKAILFTGTIRDNIRLSNEDITDEEIMKYIDIAQASEFVNNTKDKLDEVLYQGGKNLSGGQKQRLAIARALAKNSDVLILDDTKSALDFKTSLELTKALKSINKTIIEISQRASDMLHCDKVVVLDKGNIVGYGTHDELFKNNAVYQEICKSQHIGGGINE